MHMERRKSYMCSLCAVINVCSTNKMNSEVAATHCVCVSVCVSVCHVLCKTKQKKKQKKNLFFFFLSSSFVFFCSFVIDYLLHCRCVFGLFFFPASLNLFRRCLSRFSLLFLLLATATVFYYVKSSTHDFLSS